MTEFEKLMHDENVQKYEPTEVPATTLQGVVRDALKKGLERTSQEVKREVIHHQRMRGMYCSWERIEANGIFKRQ